MSCWRMRIFLSVICACLVAASPGVLSAQVTGDDLKGFWNRGDAAKFLGEVTPNSSNGLMYRDYPVVVDQIKERDQAAKIIPVSAGENHKNPSAIEDNQPAPQVPAVSSTPLSRDQILSKFGSPDEPQVIRAQKDAPPAMQGLFEALNSGDKELAWQYALALARRKVEMQKQVEKATDYQMLAMEALGMRTPQEIKADESVINPTRAELHELMLRTHAEEESRRRVNIDEALAAEAAYENPPAVTRAPQGPAIPVDPEGKVKLLVFFDEQDETSKTIGESLKNLKEKFKNDPNFSVIGLTRRTYTLAGLKYRGAALSFPFPLVNGEALALDLRIVRYPSVVFLAMTSKQTYRLEEIPSVERIEKTVQAMRGAR